MIGPILYTLKLDSICYEWLYSVHSKIRLYAVSGFILYMLKVDSICYEWIYSMHAKISKNHESLHYNIACCDVLAFNKLLFFWFAYLRHGLTTQYSLQSVLKPVAILPSAGITGGNSHTWLALKR